MVAAAPTTHPVAGLFLLLVVPFLVTWLYFYAASFPPPVWLTWATLGGAVVLGACGLLLLPMGWRWRAVLAPLYMLAMAAAQFVWMLGVACSVHGDCL